ncbi:MAG: T9SS type A sorting domain-containing protein, partial [Bacteroidia bacterium]
PCSLALEIPTGFCQDALPFCSSDGLYFPAATNTQSELGLGIECLGSTPNPAWYYLRIGESGNLDLQITANTDIDFICWGPFSEEEWESGVCSTVLNLEWASNDENVVDCSYSATNNEDFDINNAVVGEYYIVLITNYSNQNQNIYFTQDGGSGSTDCVVFCDMSIQAEVSSCDSASNSYSVSGVINIFEPPSTGILTIENSSGGFITYDAPFANTLTFIFDSLSSDGQTHSVHASFSETLFCDATFHYNAPPVCSECAVIASVPEVLCEGSLAQLSATSLVGAQYTWSGPNGFTSSLQNPEISNLNHLNQGPYTVVMTNQENNCSSVSTVNLLATPLPEIEIGPDFIVCSNEIVALGLGNNNSYEYAWFPEEWLNTADQAEAVVSFTNFTNSPLNQEFVCIATYLGCSASDTLTGTFLPVIPPFEVQVLGNGPQLFIDVVSDSVLWFIPNFPEPFAVNQDSAISPFSNILHPVYAVVVNEFGCVTYSDTLLFDPVSIYGLDAFQLNIFPNPAESQITIEAPVSSNFTLRDAGGRIVREGFLKEKSTQILISDLSEGIYMLEVANQLGKVNRLISIMHN